MRVRTRVFPELEERDYDWAFDHYVALAQRYPNQWIAFARRKVLAAGSNLQRVLTKAHEQVNRPHVPHLFVETGVHSYPHRP